MSLRCHWRSIFRPERLVVGILFLAFPIGLIVYKVHWGHYGLDTLVPVEAYQVNLEMTMVGHGDSVLVSTFLPRQTSRVTITNEKIEADRLSYSEDQSGENRIGSWSGVNVMGPQSISVAYETFAHAQRYDIDDDIRIPGPPGSRRNPYLQETPEIQVDAPEIAALAEELAPTGASLIKGLQAIHLYCQGLSTVSFKGTTDALTALRLGEASCNGKARLFVALARHQGLPSRLVGGLILEPGTKRTSHQWLEVQMGEHWVPFCPTNEHFAAIPASYLPLYYGDHALFTRTPGVNFGYHFKIRRDLTMRAELVQHSQGDPLNLISAWTTFEKAGVHLELLKILLMVPLGALILVIFRNVIGLETFGTFLPVLIAIASRTVGLWWGIATFFLLLLLVVGVRMIFKRFGLLHLPQMAVLLAFLIIFMLASAAIGARAGNLKLAYISMFPIAILTITAERFSLMIEEEGVKTTAKTAATTAIAIIACFLVMNTMTLQVLFLSFPELVLVVIFLDIWLGHWVGLRVAEYWRFRSLIAGSEGGHAASHP